ncbi:O-acetyl-ADP-ribose deacetylase (regulator of RNase III) [Paenarthrobacter nitroguajacolicus]|uniref:O-acetyl-ADP-ribose deacetylase n=1 Tax=Paenarthrobacter nitroguajacolicus TaxID=211146 RepID=UPI0028550FD9|nr:O-acetyl-ADP-ribose deacetylase [Paenarthrobacter nitroguajacolicus]MDR6986408.1 O-acetyl-ADP-ribose deacetylase (regulator of RNase III) [Paenarthrobacter nitroguajacolicus]
MRIDILQGDITNRTVDAIVNAANSSLLGGGGVDGAIHRAAGPELLEACRELRRTKLPGGLPVGAAVATPGFRLPAQWVVHTVGPNRHAGQTDPALLASCFHESLKVAAGLGARSVAFPAVSAGIYGWDARQVAEVAFDAVRSFSSSSSGGAAADSRPLEVVEFVLFSEETTAVFRTVFASSPGLDPSLKPDD